jgi:hypothetical protein
LVIIAIPRGELMIVLDLDNSEADVLRMSPLCAIRIISADIKEKQKHPLSYFV